MSALGQKRTSPLRFGTTKETPTVLASGAAGHIFSLNGALIEVGVTDREDAITELIAKSIVNVTAIGERDSRQVMERALNALGVRRSAALACRAAATGGRDMDPVARGHDNP
jgi:hypothetical protein